MSEIKVMWFDGDYRDRQKAANEAGVDIYIEQHLNAKEYDKPGTGDNPALCVVAHNASAKSKAIANEYAHRINLEFGWPNRGCVQVGYKQRGDFNLRYTKMPAVLLEPLFVSDETQAAFIQTEEGQTAIAKILVDVLRMFLPNGGTVGFSCGHTGQPSKPLDKGAPVVNSNLMESDLSMMILKETESLLKSKSNSVDSILFEMNQTIKELQSSMEQLKLFV